MKLIYTTSTTDYQPVSLEGNYLYMRYDAISSFLKSHLKQDDHLAQPQIKTKDDKIEWYSNVNGQLSRLSDLTASEREKIQMAYWAHRDSVKKVVAKFERGGKEERDWAQLLTEVYNEDNNIVLSDGNYWVVLWGWKFRNKMDLPRPDFGPDFKDDGLVLDTNSGDVKNDEEFTIPTEETPIPPKEEPPFLPDRKPDNLKKSEKKPVMLRQELSLAERIKRFLRWLVYQFWWLLLLMLLLLLLLCTLRGCHSSPPCDNCGQFEEASKRLHNIEMQLRERCSRDSLTHETH